MTTLEIVVILQFAALVFVSAIAVKLNSACAARERQIDGLRKLFGIEPGWEAALHRENAIIQQTERQKALDTTRNHLAEIIRAQMKDA